MRSRRLWRAVLFVGMGAAVFMVGADTASVLAELPLMPRHALPSSLWATWRVVHAAFMCWCAGVCWRAFKTLQKAPPPPHDRG